MRSTALGLTVWVVIAVKRTWADSMSTSDANSTEGGDLVPYKQQPTANTLCHQRGTNNLMYRKKLTVWLFWKKKQNNRIVIINSPTCHLSNSSSSNTVSAHNSSSSTSKRTATRKTLVESYRKNWIQVIVNAIIQVIVNAMFIELAKIDTLMTLDYHGDRRRTKSHLLHLLHHLPINKELSQHNAAPFYCILPTLLSARITRIPHHVHIYYGDWQKRRLV